MNATSQSDPLQTTARNPFWVLLIVFLAFALDGGARFSRLLEQRRQLRQAELNQVVNIGRLSNVLSQSRQVEAKLQGISIELIQMARTNVLAAQLVREFNITYTAGNKSAAPALEGATNATAAPVKSAEK